MTVKKRENSTYWHEHSKVCFTPNGMLFCQRDQSFEPIKAPKAVSRDTDDTPAEHIERCAIEERFPQIRPTTLDTSDSHAYFYLCIEGWALHGPTAGPFTSHGAAEKALDKIKARVAAKLKKLDTWVCPSCNVVTNRAGVQAHMQVNHGMPRSKTHRHRLECFDRQGYVVCGQG